MGDGDSYHLKPQLYPCNVTLKFPWHNNFSDQQIYCPATAFEPCFPLTKVGQIATAKCPSFTGLHTDMTRRALRICQSNGTWASHTQYGQCLALSGLLDQADDVHDTVMNVLYYLGFGISTVALLIALFIFLHFRALRCLRNTIHCHLIVSFTVRNLLWICARAVLVTGYRINHGQFMCKLAVTLFNYFHVTNFFWMFVEGLYLHTMCVWAYSVEKIKLWYYIVIGWVVPAGIIAAWVTAKILKENVPCWVRPPQTAIVYDFIYIGPMLFVLFLNVVFMASIVWVLITKLRASTAIQTKHYRKAIKALIILVPLLGLTWLLFIVPIGSSKTSRLIFQYCNIVLESNQGLAVAVFYCFLNGEVRQTIGIRISRWREHRRMRSVKYLRESYRYTPEDLIMFRSPEQHECRQALNEQLSPNSKDSGHGSIRSSDMTI